MNTFVSWLPFFGFASLFSWISFERTMMMPMSWEEKIIWLMFLLYLPLITLLFSFTMNPSSITKKIFFANVKSDVNIKVQIWWSKALLNIWQTQSIYYSIYIQMRKRERVRERERKRKITLKHTQIKELCKFI